VGLAGESIYHIWDKKRHEKRQVKKADRKKSATFFNFRGKIHEFVFFVIFDHFFGNAAFFTLYRFFFCVAFFTGVFAFFTGLLKTLCSIFLLCRFFYWIVRFFYWTPKNVV